MSLPTLRRATRADIPAMSRIRLAVTENALRDPTRITVAMYEDYPERSGRGWVAEANGEIVDASEIAYTLARPVVSLTP